MYNSFTLYISVLFHLNVNVMVTVVISCQYYENYSDTSTPHWKPKGGHEFVFRVDSDWVMYGEERLKEVMLEVIGGLCSDFVRYEYISHEVKFFDPVDITDKVNTLLENVGV